MEYVGHAVIMAAIGASLGYLYVRFVEYTCERFSPSLFLLALQVLVGLEVFLKVLDFFDIYLPYRPPPSSLLSVTGNIAWAVTIIFLCLDDDSTWRKRLK